MTEELISFASKQDMLAKWPVHRIFFSDEHGKIVSSIWRGRWDVP